MKKKESDGDKQSSVGFFRHYKIFCVNGNTGFRKESRIFLFYTFAK